MTEVGKLRVEVVGFSQHLTLRTKELSTYIELDVLGRRIMVPIEDPSLVSEVLASMQSDEERVEPAVACSTVPVVSPDPEPPRTRVALPTREPEYAEDDSADYEDDDLFAAG